VPAASELVSLVAVASSPVAFGFVREFLVALAGAGFADR
jgi:hypothetical protein